MPVRHDQQKKEAEQSLQGGKRRRSEEKTTHKRRRNTAEGEPTDHAQLQFLSVEPDTASVADQLGHCENRDRVSNAEYEDENRQQNRSPTEAGHSGQRGRYESATGKQAI